MEFGQKSNCQFFCNEKALLIYQPSIPTHSTENVLYNIFVHFTSKPVALDQMEMEQIRNNSVGKNLEI